MGERRFEDALEKFSLARDEYVEFSDSLFDLKLLHYQQSQEEIGKIRDEIMNLQKLVYTKPLGSANMIERRILELEGEIHQLEMIKPPQIDAAREPPGEVHFYIGNALFNLDRLDEALTAWETCARMSPKVSLAYNNLAVAYWKRGRVDLAMDSLDRAERLGLAVNPRFRADLQSHLSERVGSAAIGGR
jgi:tetratricopeptide (TPR) repeat protein